MQKDLEQTIANFREARRIWDEAVGREGACIETLGAAKRQREDAEERADEAERAMYRAILGK